MSQSDLFVWMKNPELLVRRGQLGAGTKQWGFVCLSLFGITLLLTIIVGAIDSGRYEWSGTPPLLWYVGAMLFVAGQAFVTRSMRVNPLFEKTARIQTDRNHEVVDGGPYQDIRHPGYIGTIAGLVLGTPLLLGSWLAFIPACLSVMLLIVRTALEDQMLHQELAGYEAYVARVPYRLVPFVW
ncbi:MAG: methyltransferase family protein [Hyphomicrobiaceae bacterium]